MKIRGPLVTLGAVVAVGAGMWLVNVSQQNTTPPAAEPAAAAPTSVSAAPAPTTPPAQQFPAKASTSAPYRRTTARSRWTSLSTGTRRSRMPATVIRSRSGFADPRSMARSGSRARTEPARSTAGCVARQSQARLRSAESHGNSTPRRCGTRPASTSTSQTPAAAAGSSTRTDRSPVCSDAPTDRRHRRLR